MPSLPLLFENPLLLLGLWECEEGQSSEMEGLWKADAAQAPPLLGVLI